MKDQYGVTLVETIIVGGLLAIILGILIFMLGTSSRQTQMAERKQFAHQNAHRFLVFLRKDLRSAASFDSTSSSLMLNLASLDESGMPWLDSVSYRWEGNIISRITESGTQRYQLQPHQEGMIQLSVTRAGNKSALCALKVFGKEGEEIVNLQERITLEGIH